MTCGNAGLLPVCSNLQSGNDIKKACLMQQNTRQASKNRVGKLTLQ